MSCEKTNICTIKINTFTNKKQTFYVSITRISILLSFGFILFDVMSKIISAGFFKSVSAECGRSSNCSYINLTGVSEPYV